MKVKLSDYVAKFVASCGVDTVFAISGGASLHLIHSVDANPSLQLVCPHHEQAAAMAADGYARAKGGIGVAMTTSGPGATNLVTGICCSYYDSVPVLYITGQVSTFRSVGDTNVRQVGFQETPTVDICRPITKYAVGLTDPLRIRYELEKAVAIMRAGRPGPAVVDIPDNLQREMIEEEDLAGFEGLAPVAPRFPGVSDTKGAILAALARAQRPVVVAGWGIHLSGMEDAFREFVEAIDVPVVSTWGAADLLPESHRLNLGRFGTHGVRHANFAVQNADLVLSLGSRLDTKATGSPIDTFARAAVKVMVDIDPFELAKFDAFGLSIDVRVQEDLADFFPAFSKADFAAVARDRAPWLQCTAGWREIFDRFDASRLAPGEGVNPYLLFSRLSEIATADATIVVDTGCSIAWSMQAWKFHGTQRFFHDFNNTAMGWSLPAAIGAWFANGRKGPLICVVGDGSFMMSMQELATLKHHGIPLKIVLVNNAGYAMIRQTQDQWLGSRYVASSREGGLSFPEFGALAQSFGLGYALVESDGDLDRELAQVFAAPGAILCEVRVPPAARVIPQVKFGRPNEDMEPLLPRELFTSQMLIER